MIFLGLRHFCFNGNLLSLKITFKNLLKFVFYDCMDIRVNILILYIKNFSLI